MAPLPQSNTTRWWALYTVNGTPHKLLIRTSASFTAVQVSTVVSTLFGNFSPMINSTTITGLEQAVLGSNVRNPQPYSGTTAFGLGSEATTDGRPRCGSFTGRSIDGRKTKSYIFGLKSFGEGDLRVDDSESVNVDNVTTYLNAVSGVFLSISGLQPVWHNYMNIGYNDHWIKEYRKIGG